MYKEILERIKRSNYIVFFGGAGVSTESGIPDFRGAEGLYGYTPEYLLSNTFFTKEPKKFYEFYRKNLIHLEAKANITHKVLGKLEKIGKLKAVITQNIDGLHQKGGSKSVYELHGSVYRNYCQLCGEEYSIESVVGIEGVPLCTCGGIIRPDVTLYEEGLNMEVFNGAINEISKADLLIIGGTSLVVYPAAGLIEYFQGQDIILINKGITSFDKRANLLVDSKLGDVFDYIDKHIKEIE